MSRLNRLHLRSPVLEFASRSRPLPSVTLRTALPAPALPFGCTAPPFLPTGPEEAPFDFCAHMRTLCADIARQCEVLRHVDVSRVLFTITPARNNRTHGLQARVTPLRFRNGETARRTRGTEYQVQRIVVDGVEMLYLMTFCVPRFLNRDFDDKLITVFHEMFHIGPLFDGDLRRHDGRYHIHSHSQKEYDAEMAHHAREYLNACRAGQSDERLHAFLRLNSAQLMHRHGSIRGIRIPRPRLLRV